MALRAGKQEAVNAVSDIGEARRLKRIRDQMMKKVSTKLAESIASGIMLTESSSTAMSTIAKSKKPAAKVTPPVPPKQPAQPKEKVKVPPKVASKPKPVKAKAKKAIAREYKRTNRVAELLAMPRSLFTVPPAEYTDRVYVESHEQSLRITAIERKTHELARKVLHDRYLNSQDEREILTMVHDGRAASCKKGKRKELVRRVRSNSMYNTLERLATFESVCHLTDDKGEYDCTEIIVNNNITIGGVRFTLGLKREWVMVPRNDTHVKATNRSKLDRFESNKSRTPGPVVDQPSKAEVAQELEDLPPWTDYALDAVRTVADSIARGYGSLEEKFDVPPYQYDPFKYHHIPRGVNVSESPHAIRNAEKHAYYQEEIVFGMTRRLRDKMRQNSAINSMWREHTYMSLPNVRMNQLTMDAYSSPSAGNPQYSPDINEQLKTEFSKQVDTKVAAKVAYYRDRFSWAIDKKAFLKEEELRIEQRRMELMGNSHLQAHLARLEQTYPSDPRAEEERYQKWLFMNTESTHEDLHYHLGEMLLADLFGIERTQAVSSEHVSYKPLPVPKYKALSRPVDNIYLDLPPTGVAPVTTETDNVSQDQPDFLSDGDVIVPFVASTSVKPEPSVLSKGLILLNSAPSWFVLQVDEPAIG